MNLQPSSYAKRILREMEQNPNVILKGTSLSLAGVSIDDKFSPHIISRLKDLIAVSTTSYARQMLESLVALAVTDTGSNDQIEAIETGNFAVYGKNSFSSTFLNSFKLRIEFALKNDDTELACRLILASSAKLYLPRLFSKTVLGAIETYPSMVVTTGSFETQVKHGIELAMLSPHATYKDLCLLRDYLEKQVFQSCHQSFGYYNFMAAWIPFFKSSNWRK